MHRRWPQGRAQKTRNNKKEKELPTTPLTKNFDFDGVSREAVAVARSLTVGRGLPSECLREGMPPSNGDKIKNVPGGRRLSMGRHESTRSQADLMEKKTMKFKIVCLSISREAVARPKLL